MKISDFGFRISDFSPTHPSFEEGLAGKFKIRNPKSEI